MTGQSTWTPEASEGFYAAPDSPSSHAPPIFRGDSSQCVGICQSGIPQSKPPTVGLFGYGDSEPYHQEKSEFSGRSSFYNPSFEQGMTKLEPVGNPQFNQCGPSPNGNQGMIDNSTPISHVYPNDINSWMFRHTEGYAV